MTEMPPPDHDPGLLDDEAQATLRAYRELHEVPELVKARVHRRLQAAERELAAERRTKLRAWAVASLAAAALLLLLARSLLPGRPGAPDAAPLGEIAPYTQVNREDAAARERASIAAGQPQEPAEAEGRATEVAASDAAAPRARPRRPAPVERAPAAVARPVAVDLAAERRLLETAWRALTQGDHARALAATRQHREDHPEGVLSPEREAIEVIARCKSGAPSGAAEAAQFAASHGQSPWLGQVRAACPAAAR